jgi:hypothetical protein
MWADFASVVVMPEELRLGPRLWRVRTGRARLPGAFRLLLRLLHGGFQKTWFAWATTLGSS